MTTDDGQLRDEPKTARDETARRDDTSSRDETSSRDDVSSREQVSPREDIAPTESVSSRGDGLPGEDGSSREVAAKGEDAAARPSAVPARPTAGQGDVLRLQPRLAPRADGLYYVSEILGYHDEAFVEAAFASVLRRAPADDERQHALSDLRSGGREKIDILRDLARTPEGKAQGAFERIAGLKQSRLARYLRGLPVVGHLWQLLAAVVRLPVALRHQRQFEAYALAQQQRIADHVNARNWERTEALGRAVADASAAVSLLSDALAETTARHAEQQSQLARRLSAHDARLDAQQEFILREQQAIVEAQKAALASAEAGLRETASEQRRELAALAARVDELSAALEAARESAGGKA